MLTLQMDIQFPEPYHNKIRKPVEYVIDTNNCWNCTSHYRNHDGYPVTGIKGKNKRISRLVYEKYNVNIPEGLMVRHTCDNRACINPNHLEIGTSLDNVTDMMSRGRGADRKGEKSPNSKLTNEQVLLIRKDPRVYREIGISYKISSATVSHIKNLKRWSHI